MSDPFLAWIAPLSAGAPTHPIAPGGPPPTVWPPGSPAHPIAPGGPPPTVGGGPIYPPPPSVWPGQPAHPIAPGGQPPGIWGGAPVPTPTPPIYHPGHPDHGLPTPPVQPGHPEHPIYHPGHPDHGLPAPPPTVGGGPIIPPIPPVDPDADFLLLIFVPGHGLKWVAVDKDLMPTHPIVIPPETDPPHPEHPIAPTPAPKK